MSFREWLSCAAQEMSKSAFDLCLTLVSNIWGARNALLWNGKHTPPMELVIMTESWLQAYHHWHSPVRSNKNKPKQRWVKPSSGWIKCNFDGAWDERS